MRRRFVFGHVIGLAAGLGAAGCATAPAPRSAVPPQYLGWKDPAAGSTPKAADPFVKPPATASIWTYRPGSILLKRFRRPAATAPPAIPATESKDALARFFPGLYGKPQGDPVRVAKARRPEGGDAPPLGRPWMARTTQPAQPSLDSPADSDIALLTTGLRVQAYPKTPSPSLPASEPAVIASRDVTNDKVSDPAPSPAPAPPRERLVSNEAPASPASSRSPDLIDAIDLSYEDAPVEPAPNRPGPDDPKVDAESRPTSATVEAPTPKGEPVIDADLAVEPMSPSPAAPPSPPPAATPVEARRTARVESNLPRDRPIDPVLQGRPRMSALDPMKLPEPEFPRTYHGESLDSVLRQETRPGTGTAADPTPSAKPARRSIVRDFLTSRLHPQSPKPDGAEKSGDREVRPTSGTGEPKSGRLESREVSQRWKLFQGVPLQGRDESSER